MHRHRNSLKRRVYGMKSGWAFCGYVFVSFIIPATAFGEEADDEKARALLRFAILKLDLYAAACKDFVPFDAAQIRQRFKQYSQDANGFDYFEPLDKKVAEVRAKLAEVSAAESRRECTDSIRRSIEEYAVVRDSFIRRMRDEKVVPPVIDPRLVDMQ